MPSSPQLRQPLGDRSNSSSPFLEGQSYATPHLSSKNLRKDGICAVTDSHKQETESDDNGDKSFVSNKFDSSTRYSNNTEDEGQLEDATFSFRHLDALLEFSQIPPNQALRSERGQKKRVKSFDENAIKEIIYSTSLFGSPCPSEPSSVTSSPNQSTSSSGSFIHEPIFDNTSIIPHSGLSDEEEWRVIGSDNSIDTYDEGEDEPTEICQVVNPVRWAFPIPKPIFMTDPAISNKTTERKLQPIGEESLEPPSAQTPPQSQINTRDVEDFSQDVTSSKPCLNRPPIPSLLSFTDNTPPSDRHRVRPERFYRSRYGPADPDSLRKWSFERHKLERTTGFPIAMSTSNPSKENYALFPRAGNLLQLRKESHTSLFDDWCLSFVDLSVIRRSLYAFDLRMRTGSGLCWAEEEEVKQLIGRHQDWEHDWDRRWRVASLLFSDDEEDIEEVF